MKPFTILPDRVRLAVRVSPRAGRDAVAGMAADAAGRPYLAVRLAAPPVDGAANKALCVFLAGLLKVSRSSISIHSGETGRIKLVDIVGDAEALAARIDALPG